MLVLENLYNETFKSFLLASLFYDVIERRCNLYIYVLKSSVNKDLNKWKVNNRRSEKCARSLSRKYNWFRLISIFQPSVDTRH